MSDKEILEEYLTTNNESLFLFRLKYKEAEAMNNTEEIEYYFNLIKNIETGEYHGQ